MQGVLMVPITIAALVRLIPSDISADPMTIHRNNKRRGTPRRLFSHSVDHSLTKAVGIEPPQQKGQADHTETHSHHSSPSPFSFTTIGDPITDSSV